MLRISLDPPGLDPGSDAHVSRWDFGEAVIVVLRPQDVLRCMQRSLGFTKDGVRSVTEPVQRKLI